MYNSLSYKTKHFLFLVVKLLIVIACGYFMYHKIFTNQQQSFSEFVSILTKNDVFSLKNIVFLIAFSLFNWIFEILKWQNLVALYQEINLKTATIQSLSSLTVSLITPNRIGEYGAKAIYFQKSLQKKILGLNLIGNLSQLSATIFFGLIGFYFFSDRFYTYQNILFYVVIIGVSIILISLFFFKKYTLKIWSFYREIPQKIILKTIGFSVVRLLIFSHQFYFLTLIFNLQIEYFNTITSIFLCYLITSVIPMFSFFDVVLKGSVAVWVFAYFNIDPFTILTITTIMWVLNFVFPASIGSYFVLTFKLPKKQSNSI